MTALVALDVGLVATRTAVAPSSLPDRISSRIRSFCFAETTGPMSVSQSRVSPSRMVDARATMRSTNSSCSESGSSSRVIDSQIWPEYSMQP